MREDVVWKSMVQDCHSFALIWSLQDFKKFLFAYDAFGATTSQESTLSIECMRGFFETLFFDIQPRQLASLNFRSFEDELLDIGVPVQCFNFVLPVVEATSVFTAVSHSGYTSG